MVRFRAAGLCLILSFFPSLGFAGWWFAPTWRDGVSPSDRERIRTTRSTAEGEGDLSLPALPMAGVLGGDAFVYNYVDLERPGSGLLDWDCSIYTYDGHNGHDIAIRGFREQAIGVPVFAAASGAVVEVVDTLADDSVDTAPKPGNHVIVDHGGGWLGYYWHIKRDSRRVAVGDRVEAGTEIAAVGSSGISTGPHLHFELHRDGEVVEPSAGPCREGDSLWQAQQPIVRRTYASEAYFSLEPIVYDDGENGFWRAILEDRRARTGAIRKGPRAVHFWTTLQNVPGNALLRWRLIDPSGQVRQERMEPLEFPTVLRWAYGEFLYEVDWDIAGDWRVEVWVDSDRLVDSRLTVVAGAKLPKNRAPAAVRVALGALRADSAKPTACVLQQDPLREDRDFDVVSYRYEWLVNGRVVRTATSAAWSDLLPAGAARASDRVTCRVRPFDGKVFGPKAEARTR